jgi:MYXO-CTERM domain-containing protein
MKRTPIALILLCGATSSSAAAQTFTNVTAESGVQALRGTKPADWWVSGLTFVDLDDDGDLDLFLSDHHAAALAALNDGTGKFTLASGTYPKSEIHNCLDIDEDGKVDMDLTYVDGGAKWWMNKTAPGSSTLQFVDSGNGNTRDGNQSRSEALVDLNRDGKLDWVRTCQGQNFKVDFGDGKGNFAEDSALIAQPQGNALDAGIIFADLDADTDLDMLVNWGGYNAPGGVDFGRARVLINDGKMNLVEKTTEVGLKTERLAILGAGDVDQDGDVDVIGLDDRKFPEVIYLNDGRGSFSALPNAVTGVTGSTQYALWGLATVTDLDNDGIADILIDGRHFFHVLRGTGGGRFVFQNTAWGGITRTAEASVDGGFAFGDIDSDGDLDLMGFSSIDPSRQVALYRNDLPARRWLNIRPVGLSGNKPAANAKIRIYEPNTDRLIWFEEVLIYSKQAQQNYYAFDALERHYGLGDRTTVDVTVTFYPSGTVVRKNGVPANTTFVIGEDGTNGTVQPPTGNPDAGSTGGASTGGSSAGGTSAGGTSPGGSSSQGGSSSGGMASGGTASGGSSPGGSSSGGAGPGGAGSAGSGQGGSATGGPGLAPSSDDSGGCGCRVDSGEHGKRAIALVAALMALVGLRRRRR